MAYYARAVGGVSIEPMQAFVDDSLPTFTNRSVLAKNTTNTTATRYHIYEHISSKRTNTQTAEFSLNYVYLRSHRHRHRHRFDNAC